MMITGTMMHRLGGRWTRGPGRRRTRRQPGATGAGPAPLQSASRRCYCRLMLLALAVILATMIAPIAIAATTITAIQITVSEVCCPGPGPRARSASDPVGDPGPDHLQFHLQHVLAPSPQRYGDR